DRRRRPDHGRGRAGDGAGAGRRRRHKKFLGDFQRDAVSDLRQPGPEVAERIEGKKFAISRFGSLSEFLTRSALRHAGVDPRDVTLLQIGATPARFTTLATG